MVGGGSGGRRGVGGVSLVQVVSGSSSESSSECEAFYGMDAQFFVETSCNVGTSPPPPPNPSYSHPSTALPCRPSVLYFCSVSKEVEKKRKYPQKRMYRMPPFFANSPAVTTTQKNCLCPSKKKLLSCPGPPSVI